MKNPTMPILRAPSFFTRTIAQDLKSLSPSDKLELIQIFWPQSDLRIEEFHEESYGSFLQFVGNEIAQLRHHELRFATGNFEGLAALIEHLRDAHSESLRDVISGVKSRFLNMDEDSIRRSIELSIRLWLTINVNSAAIAVGAVLAHASPLDWARNESLDDLVKAAFGDEEVERRPKFNSWPPELPHLGPGFTAANLVNICGVRLNWSDSLADHMSYNRKKRILTIYRHKVCLINHLKSNDHCPIPTAVLEEALATINLLFPFGDRATKRLLSQEGQLAFYGLGSYGRHRKEALGEFRFWRGQLLDLNEVYNESPQTWRQLVVDQRNKVEWAAFWITVMVGLLTLVSIPCNIIQTLFSIRQYNLALAQAATPSQGLTSSSI